jgi:hypothetical protein
MCEHRWYFCIANLCCSSLSDILAGASQVPGSFFVQYTRVRLTLIRIFLFTNQYELVATFQIDFKFANHLYVF